MLYRRYNEGEEASSVTSKVPAAYGDTRRCWAIASSQTGRRRQVVVLQSGEISSVGGEHGRLTYHVLTHLGRQEDGWADHVFGHSGPPKWYPAFHVFPFVLIL